MVQDSRLDDSRKYAIGMPTPLFGAKSSSGIDERECIDKRVIVDRNDLKYDVSLDDVCPPVNLLFSSDQKIEVAVDKFLKD